MRDPLVHHRKALEVVGMLGRRTTLHNALNRIAVYSQDSRLRAYVLEVIRDLQETRSNTLVYSLTQMGPSRESAGRVAAYCRRRLGAHTGV